MIREITKEDIEKLNNLTNYFNYKITFDEINNHPFSKYVVIDENKIIGYLNYSLYYDRIEIDYIYIINEYRNQGYASKLIEYLIDECIKNKYKNITLEVNEENKNAINLYLKYDFKIVSKRNSYYNGVDGLLMIREFGE